MFIGKTVHESSGCAALDLDCLSSDRLRDIPRWGKHLLLSFDGFSLRIHRLLFGVMRSARQ